MLGLCGTYGGPVFVHVGLWRRGWGHVEPTFGSERLRIYPIYFSTLHLSVNLLTFPSRQLFINPFISLSIHTLFAYPLSPIITDHGTPIIMDQGGIDTPPSPICNLVLKHAKGSKCPP